MFFQQFTGSSFFFNRFSSLEKIIENPNKKEKFKIEGLKASKSYDRSFLASKMFKILLNTIKPSW